MEKEVEMLLRKQHYGIVGENGAVKLCTWLKKSLHDKGFCYKQKFYGIQSHRCLQMTPVANLCNHNCLFCWRAMDYSRSRVRKFDPPELIVEESIREQQRLLTGFKGDPTANQEKVKEAFEPKHAAISLLGEPTLYPYLKELIEGYHKRGMTTFVVTNGTKPEVIRKIKPTQLYVTLPAPNERIYVELTRPLIPNGWEKLNETLELMPKIRTRKVMRLTLVKKFNMVEPERYAELLEVAEPHFVEAKAYMAVGFSVQRLGYDYMPTHEEILEFSRRIEENSDYKIIDEKRESRVVLLAKKDYEWRNLNKAQPF
ncbi:MAG TPA: 4-demethylwyosine synthase TYW1 [Candidatus Aenigmarchaeota archaeon]|nr:4-demethylwyosine synthase TYW1 [Candidatus Aenigmarchaeota archaeon]